LTKKKKKKIFNNLKRILTTLSLWLIIHNFGRFVDPVIYGDYPERIKSILGNRLPKFTEAQSKLVKGSIDFLGLSYYSAGYAETVPSANGVNVTFFTDVQSNITNVNTQKLSLPLVSVLGFSPFHV
jgi:beta-glucosidase/6-phospho-beta-glucosidase/beta-galactosidase